MTHSPLPRTAPGRDPSPPADESPGAVLPRRLAALPVDEASGARVALSPLARLLGLALLRSLPPGAGLLLPRTRSVHTFGMRFALDLHWLDGDGHVVRVDRAVPPCRVRTCCAARAVIERLAASQ